MATNDFNLPVTLLVPLTLLILPLSIFYLTQRRFVPPRSVALPSSLTSENTLKGESAEEQELIVQKAIDAPDGWFTDARTFELERRAIFSQVNRSELKVPGDSLTVLDLAVHNPYKPLPETWGLFVVQDCRFPVLPRSWKG
jgi:hypothetical protein